jgi:hypothetical protein
MKRLFLSLLVVVLYVLHQDLWFWRAARPLLFGFLPVGIWYHLLFTLAVSLVMWLLIRQAWPGHLEAEAEGENQTGAAQFSGISATEEDEAR